MQRSLILAGAMSAALAGTAYAQDSEAVSYERTELRGGVIMLTASGAGNLALIHGEDGILLIDDQLPGRGSALEAAIADIAGDGVPRFILNTHWHGDHVGTNAHFAPQGATVTAHHNVRERIRQAGDAWAQADGAAPILTFGQDISLHVNGLTVEASHVPSAHTDGDSIVYFREADVLHMGDILFSGLYPFIDLNSGGTVDGYIAGLERGLQIAGPDTQVIAGHGPLSTRADIETSLAMIRAARGDVARLVEEGLSEDEAVARNPLARFDDAWSWGFIDTERFTRTLYQDLTRETQ